MPRQTHQLPRCDAPDDELVEFANDYNRARTDAGRVALVTVIVPLRRNHGSDPDRASVHFLGALMAQAAVTRFRSQRETTPQLMERINGR